MVKNIKVEHDVIFRCMQVLMAHSLLQYLHLGIVHLCGECTSVILGSLFSDLLPEETRIYKEVSFSISFGKVGKAIPFPLAYVLWCV